MMAWESNMWDYIELELQQCIQILENYRREMKELMRSAESTRKLVHHTGFNTAIAIRSETLLITCSFSKFWIDATIMWSVKAGFP